VTSGGEQFTAAFHALPAGGFGTTSAALDYFDSLPPVTCEDMLGQWKGSDVLTGHPLDGLLGPLGWYGKAFIDAETVHPLLFEFGGKLSPINPDMVPLATVVRHPGLTHRRMVLALARMGLPLLKTRKPKARLRLTEFRGVVSATMIYDGLPIHDIFRRIAPDVLLGAMDLRFGASPFFFTLTKDDRPVGPA
jgi:hypothetical protein